MKKIVALILALVLILAVAAPAFAAGTFVPSVSYKDAPEIEDAEMNGEDVAECLIVSSIADAKNKSTDISQESRDELTEVYEALENGSMKLPIEEDHVIRDLVDVSFAETGCVEADHKKYEWLAEKGNTVSVTFDMGVDRNTEIIVLVYVNDQWIPAEKVINNGDGTVTVTFEDICPVAFCVVNGKTDGPAQTGDVLGQDLMLWILLMVVSMAGIVGLNIYRRKRA